MVRGSDGEVSPRACRRRAVAGAKTDADGMVRAEDVAPGPYALVIRGSGAGTQRHEVEVPAQPEEGGAIVRRIDIVYNAP